MPLLESKKINSTSVESRTLSNVQMELIKLLQPISFQNMRRLFQISIQSLLPKTLFEPFFYFPM